MVRPKEIKNRRVFNVVFDGDDLDQFMELVGPNNVSKEIRTFIKERIELQKKDEALTMSTKEEPHMMVNNNNINNTLIYQVSEISKLLTPFSRSCKDTAEIVKGTNDLRQWILKMDKRKRELIQSGVFLVNGKQINRNVIHR